MTSIRALLSIAATIDLEVEQLDDKTGFLHVDLEEEIYTQPSVPVEEELIWIEARSPTMVPEVQLLHDRPWIPQDAGRPLRICEEVRWS